MKTSAHMKNVESFDSSWENKNDIKILENDAEWEWDAAAVLWDVCTLKHFFSLSEQLVASLRSTHSVLRKKSQPTKL